MSFADLAADTAVTPDPDVPGRYHLTLPDSWDYLLPSGGVVMTCALRAANVHVADPTIRLASATTIFASPMHPGRLVADVHVIRRGGNTVQLRVVLRHVQEKDGQPGLELIATFARDRRGADVIGVATPALALADARSIDDGASNNPHTRLRFFHQRDARLADGGAFWRPEFREGPARYARWFRYKVPQRDADGRLDRLALPPLIDTMPTALHRAIGPGNYRFYAPSLDLTVYTIDDTTREWVLIVTTVKRAKGGWAIGDCEVWDDEGTFLAYGTQAMYLNTVSGDAPTVDASRRR